MRETKKMYDVKIKPVGNDLRCDVRNRLEKHQQIRH